MKEKQEVIIFDSPDGTGKTNISQGLSVATGIPYFRMGSQQRSNFYHFRHMDKAARREIRYG